MNQYVTKSPSGLFVIGNNQRTLQANIFSIGEAAYNRDLLFGMPLEINSGVDQQFQARVAALNILGLRVMNSYPPFSFFDFGERRLF